MGGQECGVLTRSSHSRLPSEGQTWGGGWPKGDLGKVGVLGVWPLMSSHRGVPWPTGVSEPLLAARRAAWWERALARGGGASPTPTAHLAAVIRMEVLAGNLAHSEVLSPEAPCC